MTKGVEEMQVISILFHWASQTLVNKPYTKGVTHSEEVKKLKKHILKIGGPEKDLY